MVIGEKNLYVHPTASGLFFPVLYHFFFALLCFVLTAGSVGM
jgi:hypothetical protein